jgi:LuxR family maltose regulon positive regulatory protein
MILTRKIRKPHLPLKLLERNKFISNSFLIDDSKILLLNAPAGYGKTTLFSQIVDQHQGRSTWYSLDVSDNSPQIFWTYLIHALKILDPSIGKKSLSLFKSSSQGDQHEAILHLLEDLARFQNRFLNNEIILMVFDDFQLITDPHLIEQFNFFVDYLPSSFKLCISSRSQPSLNIPKRLSKSEVTAIPYKDLLLSQREITEFFSITKGWLVSGLVLDAIYNLSNGWVGMLQIISASQELKNADSFSSLDIFIDDHSMINCYMEEEVLPRFSKHDIEILCVCGHFESVTKKFLLDVWPGEDLEGWLNKALNHNLIAQELNGTVRRYAVNETIKCYFKNTRRSIPEPNLNEKIERYLLEHGGELTLFEYGIATHNWLLAMKGCASVLKKLIRNGQYYLGKVYIEQFPENIVTHYPALRLFTIWINLYESGHEQAAKYLPEVEEYLHNLESASLDNLATLGIVDREHFQAITAMCRLTLFQVNLLKYGSVDDVQMVASIEKIARENSDFSQWSWNGLGANYFMNGKMRLAEECLFKALYQSKKDGDSFCLLSTLGCLGPCLLFLGKPNEALSLCDDVEQWCRQTGTDVSGHFSILIRVRLLISREMNHFQEAEEYNKQLDECPRYVDPLNRSYHYWAQLLYLLGRDNDACRSVLNRLQTHFKQHFQDWTLGIPSPDLIQRILNVLDGEPKEIIAWANMFRKQWSRNKSSNQQFCFELLVLSRVLLVSGKNPIEPLTFLMDSAIEEGNIYLEVKAKILFACYCIKTRSESGYLGLMIEALLKAERHELDRAILDEQEFILELLSKSLVKKLSLKHSLQNSDLWTQLISERFSESQQSSPDRLTNREQQVLDYLVEGLSNEEISQILGISKTTVKTHVTNIYGKFQVNSRLQLIKHAGTKEYVNIS